MEALKYPSWLLGLACLLQVPAGPALAFIEKGGKLPAFEMEKLGGGRLASASLAGKAGLLLFIRPGQPQSLAALKAVKEIEPALGGASFEKVAIASGQVEGKSLEELAKSSGFVGVFLLDPQRSAYAAFGVVAVPSILVFDAGSQVVWSRAGAGQDLGGQIEDGLREALRLPARDRAPAREKARSSPRIELARSLIERGDLEKAESVLRTAIEKEATPAAAALLGDVLLLRREPRKALLFFEESLVKFPREPRLEIGKARALSAVGRAGEAEAVLKEVALRFPDLWEVHSALGAMYEDAGKKDEALDEYKKVISILRKSLQERAR